MKTFVSYAKRVAVHTCVAFTLFILMLFLAGKIMPEFGNAIALDNIGPILLFSLLLGGANILLAVRRLLPALRVALHYVVCILSFLCVFLLMGQRSTLPSAIVVYLVVFTLLYVVLMGAGYLLYRLLHRRAEETADHRSLYE